MIEIFGIEYEEASGEKITLSNGKVVIHHEHERYKLIQEGTGFLFDVAEDLEGVERKYGITDVLRDDVEPEETLSEVETAKESTNETTIQFPADGLLN